MTKRDTVTNRCLDLGLHALLANTGSTESNRTVQTDISLVAENDFAELAQAGRWSELVMATEAELSSVGESFDARMWWIRAHLEGQSLPVSLLLPPFASLCRFGAQRAESDSRNQDLSEIAQAMTKRMLNTADREGLFELQGLIERYGLLTSDMVVARQSGDENAPTVDQNSLVGPLQSNEVRGRKLEKSRLSKLMIFIMVVPLGAASIWMIFRDFSPVSQLNTRAVSDRIEEQTAIASTLALPTPFTRVQLSNLDVLRYGIQREVSPASKPIHQSTASEPAPPVPAVSSTSRDQSTQNPTKGKVEKETINISGPIEGSEFRKGIERNERVRPRVPQPEVYVRPLDGGVMHAPFDSRPMVVVTSSRVFKRPSTTSAVLGQLLSGDKISVEGQFGKWARIRSRKGRVGYVPVEALGEGVDFRAP